MSDPITEAARAIHECDALLIVTGAGMGVPSGFSTFRGEDGHWPRIEEMTGMSYTEWATPVRFMEEPSLTWGFYGARIQAYRSTPPHEGYHALRRLSEDKDTFVFTTNVDGHALQVFGDDVLEVHGNIFYAQRHYVREGELTPLHDFDFQMDDIYARHWPEDEYAEVLRPNVLLFSDYHWDWTRLRAQSQRYDLWKSTCTTLEPKLVCIEIGCGTVITTGRYEAVRTSQLVKDFTHIRINPAKDPEKKVLHVQEDALSGILAIEEALAQCGRENFV